MMDRTGVLAYTLRKALKSVNCQIITNENELTALRDAWDRLHRHAAGTVFQGFEWQMTWWRLYQNRHGLRALALWEKADLVGLACFFIDSIHLPLHLELRRLRCLGESKLYGEYCPLAAAGHEEALGSFMADDIFQQLKAGAFDFVDFHHYPGPAHPVITALLANMEQRGMRVVHPSGACPRVMLRLPENWEAYLRQISKNERTNIRHGHKTLRAAGVELEILSDPAAITSAYEELVRLHGVAWKSRGQVGYYSKTEHFEEFHRLLAPTLAAGNMSRLYSYKREGRRFAMLLNYFTPGLYCAYSSGRDPNVELAKVSPGALLMAEAIRDAIELGCPLFDFMGGTEPYKLRLGGQVVPFGRAIVFDRGARSLKARAYLAALAARQRYESIRSR